MVFHKSALFTDMTENYIEPCEPKPHEKVTIRFRTGRNNVDKVMICYHGQKVMMKKEAWDDLFDYYSYHVRMSEEILYYHFEVQCGRRSCYFNRLGVSAEENPIFDFILIPGFSTPDWAKGAVMYQIYVDRFCNGDTSNDAQSGEYDYLGKPIKRVEDWNEPPEPVDLGRFYGGDLQGVIDKLDYLESLGIDVIYLNPVFVSPSNHKYDTQDYDHVDPHFGIIVRDSEENRYSKRTTDKENLEASDRLLIKLIEEAHKRGMKVILDGVFNYCSSFHRFFDREGFYANSDMPYEKGAYHDKESPYRDYFKFEKEDDKDSYEKWWGYDALPKLNYEGSSKLYEYILSVGTKWVSKPYCADGWRLDVAADLGHSREFNHKFWQDFRTAVKEANPQALILAEHYGPSKEWLTGKEWDSVMNYDAFMEPLTWFLTGMEKHSNQFHEEWLGNANIFWTSMQTAGLNFSHSSGMVAMNELSNHDHSRFLTRTNHIVGRLGERDSRDAELGVNKAIMRIAVVMQMTWPGAPTVYYGDEAGVCGFTDPDNRRTYPWGHEDQELINFHKEMIRIHKQNPELIKGSLMKLYAQPFVTAYARFTTKEQTIVIVNCSDCIRDITVNVWRAGVASNTRMNRIMVTTNEGFNTDIVQIPVMKGKLEVSLLPQSAIVLKHKNKGLMRRRKKVINYMKSRKVIDGNS
ncbi:MAG: glycoside hydrolase family 13 protein [Lachnospiraceae bacterium]|nr:glycoside hydrolase family 13 protein [Lachnospiraceae bacterium]